MSAVINLKFPEASAYCLTRAINRRSLRIKKFKTSKLHQRKLAPAIGSELKLQHANQAPSGPTRSRLDAKSSNVLGIFMGFFNLMAINYQPFPRSPRTQFHVEYKSRKFTKEAPASDKMAISNKLPFAPS